MVQCSEVTCGRFHPHWHRGRKASWQAVETDGPQASGLAPRASCRPLGLGVSFCYQAPAGTGMRNFLYLEAVPPGRTVPLLGLSLLIRNVGTVDQMIFEVSAPREW